MNYLNAENYQLLNESLSEGFSQKYGHPLKVRAFENMMFAGYDLCFGLLQFLSHRPKAGIVRLGSSLQEYLLPHFYRLQTPLVFKKENENFQQYIAQFDHEVNFVLWSSENEITGEVFLSESQRLEIHKALSAKRIYSIELKASVRDSDIEILKQSHYSVFMEVGTLFDKEQCLIYHSEKLKTPTLIGHYQNSLKSCEEYLAINTPVNNAGLIKQISEFKLNYFNRFSTVTPTLQDRLVIASKTVAGSALKTELNLTSAQAFAPSELPSWIIESIPTWWPEAKNQDLVLGLLVISLKALDASQLKKIVDAHDILTAQSTWSIS